MAHRSPMGKRCQPAEPVQGHADVFASEGSGRQRMPELVEHDRYERCRNPESCRTGGISWSENQNQQEGHVDPHRNTEESKTKHPQKVAEPPSNSVGPVGLLER